MEPSILGEKRRKSNRKNGNWKGQNSKVRNRWPHLLTFDHSNFHLSDCCSQGTFRNRTLRTRSCVTRNPLTFPFSRVNRTVPIPGTEKASGKAGLRFSVP